MKTPNPFKVRQPNFSLPTMHGAMRDSLKKPFIGVTQGGSSRKNGGAKVAATSSDKPSKEK